MTAMVNVVPRPGDLVHITERAAIAFANRPVHRFRVIDSGLIAARPGWCWLHGWDADERLRYEVTHNVLVSALVTHRD
ncbi:MAG: hypothetical protein WCA46_15410 [Actinocatenispora sp.]